MFLNVPMRGKQVRGAGYVPPATPTCPRSARACQGVRSRLRAHHGEHLGIHHLRAVAGISITSSGGSPATDASKYRLTRDPSQQQVPVSRRARSSADQLGGHAEGGVSGRGVTLLRLAHRQFPLDSGKHCRADGAVVPLRIAAQPAWTASGMFHLQVRHSMTVACVRASQQALVGMRPSSSPYRHSSYSGSSSTNARTMPS